MKLRRSLSLRETAVFAMLGAILLIGKILFEPLPNVHPLAALIAVYTLVYRARALIPIYVYVILQGLIGGFNMWWVPYLYVWTVLWGMFMLLPRGIENEKYGFAVIPAICALHGAIFGLIYSPAQAFLFGLDLEGTLKWIAAGLPFDLAHAVGNFAAGFLVIPLTRVLKKMEGNKRS
jgi:energy-coupling factor transport system substrate-specific component